jgi:phosphoribosylformylglycinamidine synthase
VAGYGINCEEETAAAYRLAGARAEIVHLGEILRGRVSIHEFQIFNLPGGFSFGDDLGSGSVLANMLRHRRLPNGRTLREELEEFLAGGGYILGICNGFQVLVRMGLLPGLTGEWTRQATLTENDSGRFEDRWCLCRVTPGNPSPFLAGLDLLPLPVRHGEGKLVLAGEAVRRQIVARRLNCLTYCDAEGRPAGDYPANPNGSELACAGLTDPSGQVLGMMPHPEAFLTIYNHPDWPRLLRQDPERSREGAGLRIFRNIVRHLAGGSARGGAGGEGQESEE